jgi:hypothetical protein
MRLESNCSQLVGRGRAGGGLLQTAFLYTKYYNSRIYYYICILYCFEAFVFVVMRTKCKLIFNTASLWYFFVVAVLFQLTQPERQLLASGDREIF